MGSKIQWFFLIGFLTAFCWFGWKGQAQTPKNSWEYRVVPVQRPEIQPALSELGREGWELVTIRTEEKVTGPVRNTTDYYYFKRPR